MNRLRLLWSVAIQFRGGNRAVPLQCGCLEKEKGKVACPTKGKSQQSSTQAGVPESTAKEGGSQREIRRTFKMLREVWLNIGVEKIDIYKRIMSWPNLAEYYLRLVSIPEVCIDLVSIS